MWRISKQPFVVTTRFPARCACRAACKAPVTDVSLPMDCLGTLDERYAFVRDHLGCAFVREANGPVDIARLGILDDKRREEAVPRASEVSHLDFFDGIVLTSVLDATAASRTDYLLCERGSDGTLRVLVLRTVNLYKRSLSRPWPKHFFGINKNGIVMPTDILYVRFGQESFVVIRNGDDVIRLERELPYVNARNRRVGIDTQERMVATLVDIPSLDGTLPPRIRHETTVCIDGPYITLNILSHARIFRFPDNAKHGYGQIGCETICMAVDEPVETAIAYNKNLFGHLYWNDYTLC